MIYARRAGPSRTSRPSSVCRSRRCRSGCATSRCRTASTPSLGNARRPHPQHLAKLAEIAECDRDGIERDRHAVRRCVPRGRRCFVRRGGCEARQGRSSSRTPDPLHRSPSSAPGCAASSLSTSAGSASASTCTRASTSTRRSSIGPKSRRFHALSSGAPYRAAANPTIRTNKHEYGCAYVRYCSARTHRQIMGLVGALLSSIDPSGVAQLAARRTVNP